MRKVYFLILLSITSVVSLFAQNQDADKQGFSRRVVMEEYTGTWCGNCPRGSVGMERISEQFGDDVICIAIHSGSGEPMQIATYPDLQPGSGIPACTLNRRGKLDPYSGSGGRGYNHFGLDLDVASILNEPTEAGIELSAEWNDEYQWDVRFDVTTTFAESAETANYRLALILLEDGLNGMGRAWEQVNYYSAEYSNSMSSTYADDDMKKWVDAPASVADLDYNHVPVNTLGIKNGIEGSIQSPVIAMQQQHYSNIVTTLNQKVIQDKSRLSAVVLLLNTDNGQIVNAAKAEIKPYGSQSSITSIDTESNNKPTIYNLKGQRMTTPTDKGIIIIDGKKILR